MLTETEAKGVVNKNRGGEIEGCYGPSRIAGHDVWEVWAHDGDEYVTRFVATAATGAPAQYYTSFGELCAQLSKIHEAQEATIAALSASRHDSSVRLYVAAAVFMAAVGVLLYLAIKGASPNTITFGVLASLIASGGVMFYGAWRQFDVPDASGR